ncbi:hypothetical protein ET445_10090 [Agromyces protaetiae]|uniref:Uncharacterized protein n=1 Tax=Agromyces protaetiae TaxID=2509455 RepID=A0A4P6FGP4_9MICO|nr:hypothetical protein [Agromyces protaetiae]QAY73639.1 hypothetical protein ET445_10090 [Agromyces protaetiae]
MDAAPFDAEVPADFAAAPRAEVADFEASRDAAVRADVPVPRAARAVDVGFAAEASPFVAVFFAAALFAAVLFAAVLFAAVLFAAGRSAAVGFTREEVPVEASARSEAS